MPSDARARPILMSGPMVRAILSGRKTQTRRVIKPQPLLSYIVQCDEPGLWGDEEGEVQFPCPFGQPGDLLWCREAWKPHSIYAHLKPRDVPRSNVFFRADDRYAPSNTPWRPGIHMPRWASRLTLELTDVRAQRVQEISEGDAEAEGMGEPYLGDGDAPFTESPVLVSRRMQFRNLWNDLRGHGWNENPFVWSLSFSVIHKNVDEVLRGRAS